MTKLRQLCNNDPAVAIKALIDGLMRHQKIKDFRLDFDHNGVWKNSMCYGGAATLVLIELLDMSFAAPELEDSATIANLMWTDRRDLSDFEEAIEFFRVGYPREIEEYFELPTSGVTELGWNLQNNNWKYELPKIIQFWEQLTGQTYEILSQDTAQRWRNAVTVSLQQNHFVSC